jgi:hypothetical protein
MEIYELRTRFYMAIKQCCAHRVTARHELNQPQQVQEWFGKTTSIQYRDSESKRRKHEKKNIK